ncbi:MAG: endonuclease III [Bacteroidetes bacterium]|nr:endonuclease III [Bacteroidota bacterium]
MSAQQSLKNRIPSELQIVASRLRDFLGEPRRGRKLPDPLELLIATVLSQNTNDLNSHKAFTNLKTRYPNFLSLAQVSPRKIEPLIKVGGIANKKSKTIVRLVRDVEAIFGKFDRRRLKKMERAKLIDDLCSLGGVGYKTAACVSLFALGDDDAFPVDTHVHRILNRIGIVREKTPDKTYLAVRDRIPRSRGYELHINLIRFGRRICTAQKPQCHECILFDVCRWKEKDVQHPGTPVQKNGKNADFMLLESV